MLFSSFCWHAEDSYLFSMNYLHCGASKTWYAAPGSQALKLQQAMRLHYPRLFAQQPDAQHSLTLQMSPFVLRERYGVDVCHTVQRAGEFVCTFPAAFHCGFSHGFNVGEAVNFAIAPWLPFGRQAQEIDRQHARPQVFSLQQLIIAMTGAVTAQWERLGEDDVADSAWPNAEESRILLSELQLLVAAEQRERTACVSLGLTRFVPVQALQGALVQMAAGPPLCSICALLCFVSFASCGRCRLPAVCLRHVEFACSCNGCDALSVVYRWSVGQLQDMSERLRRAVRKKEASALSPSLTNGGARFGQKHHRSHSDHNLGGDAQREKKRKKAKSSEDVTVGDD